MEKIIVPAKTYKLYVNGYRTFIHLKIERKDEIEKIKFGETVILVNEENENERQVVEVLAHFRGVAEE